MVLFILTFMLSGCTTYKFMKSTSGSQGYLACYDGYPISEYTLGKEKSLPDLTLAKERFKRRKSTVEYYYKQMDLIESRLKAFLGEPPKMIVGFLSGVFRWPFIAVADYKYNHNPKYQAKVDRLDEEKEALETVRLDSLRKKLDVYIAQDLANESLPQGIAKVKPKSHPEISPVIPEVVPKAETSLVNSETVSESSAPVAAIKEEESVAKPSVEPPAATQSPVEIQPVVEKTPAVKVALEPPVAVIIAQPLKGYSPLKVNFSGQKSYSKTGKIVAYDWNFGDGDNSTQKNPVNTYWSTTFGSRNFTATLTVRDDVGNTSVASTTIEVVTK